MFAICLSGSHLVLTSHQHSSTISFSKTYSSLLKNVTNTVNIDGGVLSNLRFADDIDLMGLGRNSERTPDLNNNTRI